MNTATRSHHICFGNIVLDILHFHLIGKLRTVEKSLIGSALKDDEENRKQTTTTEALRLILIRVVCQELNEDKT